MSFGSYETFIVVDIKNKVLPKERTLKGYLNKINAYFEVDLDNGFYNLNGNLDERFEFEMIMNIVKAYIIFRLEVGNLYCEIKNNKVYIKELGR